MLKFSDVDAYYGAHHVLRGVDYEVFDKEIVCLLGGNASGKSTTMKAILGLVRPTNGTIQFLGQRIDQWETSDIVKSRCRTGSGGTADISSDVGSRKPRDGRLCPQ